MTDTNNPREKTFGLRDAVFICLYVAAAAVCLFLFWRDLNRSFARLNEQPAGLITWKYRSAQRRFAERVLWERLKTESPVYDGDTVRTADVSEATVNLFAGGGIIELGENTLIRIAVGKEGALINLADGMLSAAARDGRLRITSGGVTVDAAPGAVVAAAVPDAAGPAGLELRVLEGSAGIRRGGELRRVAAGEIFSTVAAAARVAVLSPSPQAKYLNNGEGPLDVAFRWNRIGFAARERVRLDIAEDRGFTRVIESRESDGGGETLGLTNGVYYWRAYPASEAGAEIRQGGVSGKLTLRYAPPPGLYRPAQGERFRFRTSRPGLRFQWQALEGAAAYLIEISSSPALENPLFSAPVQPAGGDTVSIVHSGFPAGLYYWRVTPVYPRDYTGRAQSSAISSFTIEQLDMLPAPQTPEQVEMVYLEAYQQDTYFTWKTEDDAAYYTFLLSRQEDLGNPLIRKRELDNYYVLNAREAGLMPGRYYWGVFQTDMEGNDSALSRPQILMVMAGAPPERTARPESAARRPEAAAERPAVPAAPANAAPPPGPGPGETAPETPAAPAVPAAAVAAPPSAASRPLPAPRNLRPAAGYVLNEEIILRDKQIVFSWEPVPGAAGYTFVLYQDEGGTNREVLRRTALGGTSFTLTDLTVLDAGEFVWQAAAESGAAGQGSEAAVNRFRVDLDEIEASEGRESGIMFGRD
jgi:hypothetical protein